MYSLSQSLEQLLAFARDAFGSSLLFPLLIALALFAVLATVVFRGEEVAAPPPPPPAAAAAAPAAPPVSVLVVDDSAVVRAKLRKLLESAGYAVAVARDGLEALDALSRSFYNVLVTDLEMPNMSGMELIASVQGALDTEDLPIIAITGHDELQAHVRDYEGLYGLFRKPWSDRELLRRIEALSTLRRPRPPAPARATA